MTITELIAALEAIRAERGDIQVLAYDPGYGSSELLPVEPGDVYVPFGKDYVVVAP